jgi:crotonobetainyl-CoA:carnitine CoA-transferase CaiB-like acyl-CoA transferase
MGALDGIKVIEAGLLVQGPQAAALLGDWGADVIKVELPGFGDQSRWLPSNEEDRRSGYFIGCNRGKRSVTVDLRTDPGKEVFLRLVEGADVLITNFKPGTMEDWGLGYDALAARNPRIVYGSGSTFGPLGPNAPREGADLSGQSAGGLISTTGRPGREPTPVGATIADHIASQNLVGGILAALLARERTGRGQHVEASLLGGQIWAQASEYTSYLVTGKLPGRSNRGNALIAGLYAIFPTSDGWIAVVGVVGAARESFFRTVGRPDLGERFSQPFYYEGDKNELYPQLDAAFVTKTTSEWCQALADAGIRHAPVRNYAEVVADQAMWDNGYFAEVETPDGDKVRVVGNPVRFSDTPARFRAVPPELGQHTEEVLLEVGYTWEQIARLSEQGAV